MHGLCYLFSRDILVMRTRAYIQEHIHLRTTSPDRTSRVAHEIQRWLLPLGRSGCAGECFPIYISYNRRGEVTQLQQIGEEKYSILVLHN